jgi:hypothetical protein
MNPLRRLSSQPFRSWRPRRRLVSLRLEELEARTTPSVTVVPQQFTTNQYTALNITQSQLLAGDTGSGVLVASNPTQPANATLVDNQNGTWTFTPNPSFSGSTTFQYTVSTSPFQLTVNNTADLGPAGLGISVAIDGDTAVVGAPDTMVNGIDAGAAYVFVRSGNTWTQQAELTATNGMPGQQFGVSVAVSGDTTVIGSQQTVNGNVYQGNAFVFVRSGTTWTQQAELTVPNSNGNTNFATQVALDGDTAVLTSSTTTSNSTGTIFYNTDYVFVRSGTTWSQQAALTVPDSIATATDSVATDETGFSISGDTVVIGVDLHHANESLSGVALVYVRSGSTWSLQAELDDPAGPVYDGFGEALSVSGDTVVIGAQFATVNGTHDQGAAYVFVRSGTSWTEQADLTPADGTANQNFGGTVALDGDTAVVSAGATYVFVRSGGTWSQEQELTNAGPGLAISGDTAIMRGFPSPQTGQGEAVAQDLGAATAIATVQVNPATAQLFVSPASLPPGTQGQVYPRTTFTATGGAGSGYTFRESGILPAGITFDAATGQLTGTPTQLGTFPGIVIAAGDGRGDSGSQTYTLIVNHYGVNGFPVPYPLTIYAPPTSTSDPNANLDAYITGLYNSVLDRNPEAGATSLPFWENVYNLVQTGAQANPLNLNVPAGTAAYQYVADGIWQSQEHRWDEVETYYQDFLGRTLNLNNAHNVSEGQYWVNQFQYAGATEEVVIRGFLSSPEYLYDYRAAAQLTTPLNTNLLSGLATSQDLQTWNADLSALDAQRASLANQTFATPEDYTAQLSAANLDELDNETAKTGVLFDMLASNEYQQSALDSFYQAFLRRTGTAAEKQALLSLQDANGNPLNLGAIAEMLLASPEYRTNAINSEV